jgi:hypothetical protein
MENYMENYILGHWLLRNFVSRCQHLRLAPYELARHVHLVLREQGVAEGGGEEEDVVVDKAVDAVIESLSQVYIHIYNPKP